MHHVLFTFFLYQLGFTWLLDAGWGSMTLGWWPTLCIKHNFSCRSQHEHNLSIYSHIVHYLMLYGLLYIYYIHIHTYISYHIISIHINSYQFISYHINSYHIISYHINSYQFNSYHIISIHIISYHINSYHIILIHINSYHIISYHINSYAHKILAARHLVFSDIFVSVSVRITCAWGDTPRTSWYDFWEDDPSIFRSGLREHLHETPNHFGAKNQPVSCRFSQPTLWQSYLVMKLNFKFWGFPFFAFWMVISPFFLFNCLTV